MKHRDRQLLWESLSRAGVVTGELPDTTAAPWYIRAMLGCAGWFGASFFLGFIGAAFSVVFDRAGGALFIALICSGAAGAIFRFAPRNDTLAQFGLALGLSGQALWALAVFQHFDGDAAGGFFVFAAIEALLVVLLADGLHRIFATLASVGALTFGLSFLGLDPLSLPLVAGGAFLLWRNELQLFGRAELWPALAYGLTFALIGLAASGFVAGGPGELFDRPGMTWLQRHGARIGSAGIGLLLLVHTRDLLQRFAIPPASRAGLAALTAIGLTVLVMLPVPGLVAAFLLLLLGYGNGNRVLFGLGLTTLIAFLFTWYYRLDQTLLVKAELLAATGTLLLLGRLLLRHLPPASDGGPHA